MRTLTDIGKKLILTLIKMLENVLFLRICDQSSQKSQIGRKFFIRKHQSWVSENVECSAAFKFVVTG
jgi:hypothetical protein